MVGTRRRFLVLVAVLTVLSAVNAPGAAHFGGVPGKTLGRGPHLRPAELGAGTFAGLVDPNAALASQSGTTANPPNDAGASPAYDGSLEYQGGVVQHDPTLYAIFWLPSGDHSCANLPCHYEPGIIDGDFGNTSTGYLGYAGLMDRYLQDVGSTGEAMVASQYYDTTSGFARSIGTSYHFGGQWRDTSAYPHSGSGSDPLQDADIQGAVNRALTANPSWKDRVNSTFFVFTALGIESCKDPTNGCTLNVTTRPPGWSSVSYCAYHSYFTDANRHTAVYANMPDVETWPSVIGEGCHATGALPNGDIYADNEFTTLSHELFESATDPTNPGGWRDNTSQSESGDPCANHFGYNPYFGPSNTNVNGHLYNVQEEASNENGGCSEDVSQPGDGSYYLLYGPYTVTAGLSTGNINLAQTVLAPNRNCCGTANPSIDWGDGTSSEPGGDTGCIICNLTGSHTYAFDPSASYPKTYTVTVTYWTGLYFCGCFLDSDTKRSISLHIIVFQPTTDTLTIAADNQTMSYGGTVPTFTASIGGFINGDTSSVITGLTCGATDGQGHPVSSTTPVGTYTITCSNATAPSYYVISYAAGTLVVNPAPLTITADNQTKVYGAQLPALTWTGTGWVNGDGPGTLTTQPACTTTATAQSHVSGNPYSITCSGAAAANYAIGYSAGTLTVTTAPLTIRADNQTMPYGGPLPALTVSYSGLVNGDTPASLTTPPTCTTTATAASHVSGNPYGITCSGAVDTDYSISYVAGRLTIQPASLTITADNKTVQYSDQIPALTVSYAGFANGDGSGVLSGTLTCSSNANVTANGQVLSPAGAYTITCTGLSDGDYTITFKTGTLTVATEDTVIRPAQNNPSAVAVTEPGGSAPAMTFTARITEVADGSYGDITLAKPINFTLTPIGSGSSYNCTTSTPTKVVPATSISPGFEVVGCTIPAGTAVNVYDVTVSVGGSFYHGSADTVVTVYDPSQTGVESGSGTVTNPNTGNTVSFGFTASRNKSGGVVGKMLYLETDSNGTPVAVLKGNVMSTLAVTTTNGSYPETAKITGKATLNGVGNYSYTLQGLDAAGGMNPDADQYGLQVTDPNKVGVPSLSFGLQNLLTGNILAS